MSSDGTGCSGAGGVYEISVAGALGPVLRHALRPCRTSDPSFATFVRVTGPAEEDVVEVLARLAALGLEVDGVTLVP